jgi:hypothetical protein
MVIVHPSKMSVYIYQAQRCQINNPEVQIMDPNRRDRNANLSLQATVLKVTSKTNVAVCTKVFYPPWHLSQFTS